MLPTRGDGFYSTPELATLLGVSPSTIRTWRKNGILAAQGLDERGRPLHTAAAGRAAERKVRENGIAKGGYDPRLLRAAPRAA